MVILDEGVKLRIAKWTAADPTSGCHLWAGALANGYACLRIKNKTEKVTRLLMAEQIGRKLLPDEHVLHGCDVACCVNPAHLKVGTHQQNMSEAWARRRPRRKGEGVGRAKLTHAQVTEIRESKSSQRALAKLYGVAPSTICFAKRGITWSEVA